MAEVSPDRIREILAAKKQVPAPAQEQSRAPDRELLIIRQACIKAACELFADVPAQNKVPVVKDAAEKFEQWILRRS